MKDNILPNWHPPICAYSTQPYPSIPYRHTIDPAPTANFWRRQLSEYSKTTKYLHPNYVASLQTTKPRTEKRKCGVGKKKKCPKGSKRVTLPTNPLPGEIINAHSGIEINRDPVIQLIPPSGAAPVTVEKTAPIISSSLAPTITPPKKARKQATPKKVAEKPVTVDTTFSRKTQNE